MEAESEIKILERRYRKMEEALILICHLDYSRAAVNMSALKAVELAREALTSYK